MKIILFGAYIRNVIYTVIFSLALFTNMLFAQVIDDFGFQRSNQTAVLGFGGTPLQHAWAGGMNNCQFSAIDLNYDNIKDLFVFDRLGNRIMTFLNDGTPGISAFHLAPEYVPAFPELMDWVILADYNCDGMADIFTYNAGGIRVFKNTGSAASGLKFKLQSNAVLSFQFLNYLNIYAGSTDFPAISDIDQDGDLDILNFWILGTYMGYHRNMSVEKFGNCDSLDYRLEAFCWGYFKEGDTTNSIELNISCPFDHCGHGGTQPARGGGSRGNEKHAGSTLMTLDLNGDQLADLLLGDIDYPGLLALINGGNLDTARMISIIQSFPPGPVPVRLYSMPAPSYLDTGNDGKNDLIVSPFDPTFNISENRRSVWLYENTGTSSSPQFVFSKSDFLQDEMIDAGSWAHPVLFDVNNDGLLDMVVGSYGYYDSSYYSLGYLYASYTSRLLLYMNEGTAGQPLFQLADTNFAGIFQLKLRDAFPAFGDVDGDGDADMILGKEDGTLSFCRNNAGTGSIPVFAPPVHAYQGIDAGKNAAPQLFDLDKDGKPDLILGNRGGFLQYYHNTGSLTNPVFTLADDSLGKVDLRNLNLNYDGYSIPCFFRKAGDTTLLFAGSLNGGISYYKDIDGNLQGTFTKVADNYQFLRDGDHSSPAVAELNGDSFPELLMGTHSGGVLFFRGTQPGLVGMAEPTAAATGFRVFPNPGRDVFRVELDAGIQSVPVYIELYDLTGRKVWSIGAEPAKSLEISLGSLLPGIYFMKCSFVGDGEMPGIQKVIICR